MIGVAETRMLDVQLLICVPASFYEIPMIDRVVSCGVVCDFYHISSIAASISNFDLAQTRDE